MEAALGHADLARMSHPLCERGRLLPQIPRLDPSSLPGGHHGHPILPARKPRCGALQKHAVCRAAQMVRLPWPLVCPLSWEARGPGPSVRLDLALSAGFYSIIKAPSGLSYSPPWPPVPLTSTFLLGFSPSGTVLGFGQL